LSQVMLEVIFRSLGVLLVMLEVIFYSFGVLLVMLEVIFCISKNNKDYQKMNEKQPNLYDVVVSRCFNVLQLPGEPPRSSPAPQPRQGMTSWDAYYLLKDFDVLLKDDKKVFQAIHLMFSLKDLITWGDIENVINKIWNVQKLQEIVNDLEKNQSNDEFDILKNAILKNRITHIEETKKKLLCVFICRMIEIECDI
jgi:hypothetical protein